MFNFAFIRVVLLEFLSDFSLGKLSSCSFKVHTTRSEMIDRKIVIVCLACLLGTINDNSPIPLTSDEIVVDSTAVAIHYRKTAESYLTVCINSADLRHKMCIG